MSRFKIVDNVKINLTAEENAIEDQKEKTHKENELNRKLDNLRSTRNYLLSKTDWTANSDVTMSDAMKTYRQQLRDATTGLDTVEKVKAYEFPTEVTK
tara:strand:- start:36 stop:329 length:294 start_codon:yes stop_codon:yes gene_type:complete